MHSKEQNDKDTLLSYLEIVPNDESVTSIILEKYYLPIKDELDARRQNNLKLLESYLYCYANDVTLPEVLPVWQDEQEVIYFLPEEKRFARLQCLHLNKETLARNTSIAVVGQFWTDNIIDYEQRTSLTPENRYLDMDIPMYLIYTAEEWAAFLQLIDVKLLLESKRIVFLVGMNNVRKHFQGNGVIFPQQIHGTALTSEYDSTIKELFQNKISQFEADLNEIQQYYSGNEAEVNHHFAEDKPKILFITTHFSTAVQYHTRDCMMAAQRLGCDTALLIEKDPLHRADDFFAARIVVEFKPDAAFLIDHFRFEQNAKIYPNQIIFIMWVQDPMPYITNPSTPSKLHKRDFIMNHFPTWKTFLNMPYDKEQIIEAPVPADSIIYHPYELSDEEVRQYGADICIVGHASDVDGVIARITNMFDSASQRLIADMCREYHRIAYKGVLYYTSEEFKNFISDFLRKKYMAVIPEPVLDNLVGQMTFYNKAVFLQVLADWLIAAGLKNIKLWGDGWLKYEKYKSYAMGRAQNGETLSKIYQASKIVMGNNIIITGAARAWESMLSGAFYMSNYIPPEADWTDIRKIMKPNEELVMFYNRKDLIKKVRYYLKHDEERREMARRGREVALQKMTYDALMKRVIQFIGDKLKERQEAQTSIES